MMPTRHDHRACIAEARRRAEQICADRGQRLTPLRAQVLRLVWQSHRPVGAYEVLEQLAKSHPAARPPTVYRALDFLLAQGLIHKIESRNAYLGCARAGKDHEGVFLICTSCGVAEEVIDPSITQALAAAAKRARFRAEGQVVEINGVCASCQH